MTCTVSCIQLRLLLGGSVELGSRRTSVTSVRTVQNALLRVPRSLSHNVCVDILCILCRCLYQWLLATSRCSIGTIPVIMLCPCLVRSLHV
jgi:hypothetical protein